VDGIDKPVILVLSSWSSGSSAVAGYLSNCGAFPCPPLYTTNDPLTPTSYEPDELRKILLEHFDEHTLKRKFPGDEFSTQYISFLQSALRKFQETKDERIILKHPLLIYFLGEIRKLHPIKVVVVTRPLDMIEKSMRRRKWDWNPMYGKAGAQIIYNRIYEELHATSTSYFSIAYDDFLKDESIRLALVDFCELDPNAQQLQNANHFLRAD
jgi:hypothetical protein